jgi:hypothetical protein
VAAKAARAMKKIYQFFQMFNMRTWRESAAGPVRRPHTRVNACKACHKHGQKSQKPLRVGRKAL